MKTIKAAASLILLSSATALAADLPQIKSAPIPAPIWTGFYAGLNAGGTWASNNNVHITQRPAWINPNLTTRESTVALMAGTSGGGGGSVIMPNNGSIIGGGQVGYNEQIQDKVVIGVEADIQGIGGANTYSSLYDLFEFKYFSTALGQTITNRVDQYYTASKNIYYLGTARTRFGYLVTPNTLVYLTGGLAYGGASLNIFGNSQHLNSVAEEIGPGTTFNNGTRVGWTAGAGIEWMFSQSWSLKAEYLYYCLNPISMSIGSSFHVMNIAANGISVGDVISAFNFRTNTNFNGNIIRTGINYHFNFASAPVVAKF
jgi:outer membrane immunogenic protein